MDLKQPMKHTRRNFWALGLASALAVVSCMSSVAGSLYGLAGKSVDDNNFVVAFNGFSDEAKKNGDTAIHIGSAGAAHFRSQDAAISAAVKKGIKGLALSVTFSEYLVEHSLKEVSAAGIPVVTFDSDLGSRYTPLRKGYVGPNNVEFGRSFGELANKLKPRGGKVWLMSADARDVNLDDRIHGIRMELSGNVNYPRDKRLSGEGGWFENDRSPWYSGDNNPRSLQQLAISLEADNDVFMAVGHWPVGSTDAYIKTVAPFKDDLISKRKIVIVGIGSPSPGQLDVLKSKLISGYVVIDFYEIGGMAYRALKQAVEGKPLPDKSIAKSAVLE
ncbi:MAG: substrate-binding domain-containing protein [Burkholderiales bacterium]|nr:substrate-binding domain-containing protein [Burkholderiales bacterium]